MKKLWMVGALILTVAVLFVLTPNTTAGAATSDFQIEGTTLVSYTGTATTVSVPATVEKIGRSAFEDNNKIEKITIPDSVTEIEEYAFWGCDNLEKVVLGKGLYEVADFTFTACPNLKEVYIPDNIRRIGIMTFADCVSLQEISIPVSVTDIHETAFDGVTDLDIQAELYSYPYRYALARGEQLANAPFSPLATEAPVVEATPEPVPVWTPAPTPTKTPVAGVIMGSTSIVGNKAVVLMDNTTMEASNGADIDVSIYQEKELEEVQILDWTYYGDKSLRKMELAEGTTEIGAFGFARSSLKSISLPQGLTKIEYAAFYHCDALDEIIIPNTVTRIEAKAFTFTPWLESFFDGSTELVGDSDFLIVGDGVLLAYRGASEKVIIPEGVKHIAAEAFLNHEEIKEVQLPSTLLTLDSTAFTGCVYQP
ncbi:MAG: leucine-rich repeat domain-containing protein [Lachnospiraceae bacterium]|nr:leucine-rich repeat domain-containing protein [Lachnospiraceae bacterium]MBQ7777161.1 leucine-rich repeat domain-containing protein [Lachnospiraceae bacterium]